MPQRRWRRQRRQRQPGNDVDDGSELGDGSDDGDELTMNGPSVGLSRKRVVKRIIWETPRERRTKGGDQTMKIKFKERVHSSEETAI